MKKLIAILSGIALTLTLTACGNTEKSDAVDSVYTPSTEESTKESSQQPAQESAGVPAENGSDTPGSTTLVVYYSASGNTERVARDIAAVTGADLFEIVPTEIYTDEDLDWTNPDSRVCREHDDETLQNVALVTTEVPDWDSYDTVFLGYPIWWGAAAWPVNGFVTANDFTGKTVIPFATSASSGIGQSGSLLSEMAGTGSWSEGRRFSSDVSYSDIESWIAGLGFPFT